MNLLIDTNIILDVLCNRADYIITRNIKDFVNSNIRAITPDEFLKNM